MMPAPTASGSAAVPAGVSPAGQPPAAAVPAGLPGLSGGAPQDAPPLPGPALGRVGRGAPPQQLAEASELLTQAGKALSSVRFSLDVLVENLGTSLREASAAASAAHAAGTTAATSGGALPLGTAGASGAAAGGVPRLGSGVGGAGPAASGSPAPSPWRGAAEKARDGAALAVRQFHGAVTTLSTTAKFLEEMGVLSTQPPSGAAPGSAAPTGTKGPPTAAGAVAGQASGVRVKGEAGQAAAGEGGGTQGPVTLFPGRVPLVCPDGVMQSYAWKRQIAGHAATGAALRARLALESFRSHRKRIFPQMHITPPELAPVPPKRPRLAEAAPEGTPLEPQPNPSTVSADTPLPSVGEDGTAGPGQGKDQGQGQKEGQASLGGKQPLPGSAGEAQGDAVKEEAEAEGGPAPAPAPQAREAAAAAGAGGESTGAGGTEAGAPGVGPTGTGANGTAAAAQGTGSEAQPTGPSIPSQAPPSATPAPPAPLPAPAPPVPLPAPALGPKTLGKPLHQGKGALGRPGFRGGLLGSRLPPMRSATAMEADDLGPLEEETTVMPLPDPGAGAGGPEALGEATPSDAAGGTPEKTPAAAAGASATAGAGAGTGVGTGAEVEVGKPMAMDADDLGPMETEEVLPGADAPAAPGEAPATGEKPHEAGGAEGNGKEGPTEGAKGDAAGEGGEEGQAMDVDSVGAGAQGKAEGVPGPPGKGVPGAEAGSAAAGAGAPGATGDAAPSAPGVKAQPPGEGGAMGGEAADSDSGEAGGAPAPVDPSAPAAATGEGEGADVGTGAAAAAGDAVQAVQAQPDAPPPAVTVLPVEEYRSGRPLKRALREVVKESAGCERGVQVAVCSRREWVQAVASAWGQSLSAPQAGPGHAPALTGPGPGPVPGLASGGSGEAGSGEAWQRRTLWVPALSATGEGEESEGGSEEGGGAGRVGAGAGAGVGAGGGLESGTGSLSSGRGEGTAVQKLGVGSKAGGLPGEGLDGAGAQRPGMSTMGTAREGENMSGGGSEGERGEKGGRGEGDGGHLLGVVEVLLPGVVRAVLSLAPAGSCCVTRVGLFAHNEMGPHVSPWGQSQHGFLRRVAEQMQPLVLCPPEGGGGEAGHLRRVVDEVVKLSDLFSVERGFLAMG